MKRSNSVWKTRQNLAPYIFIAPFFILFSIFMVYPFCFSFILSFHKWNGIGKMKWLGMQNYVNLFKDTIFLQSLVNGFIEFLMYVPFMTIAALILGVLLNQQWIKLKGFFRAAIFIPNITSVVAVSYVFLLAFDTDYGIINMLLGKIGIPAIEWFSSPMGARFVIGALVTWRYLGYNMILMMAGLSSISEDIYEASCIDSATPVQAFIKITLPLMKPVILFCTIMSTIGTFALFTEPYVLTNGVGGPFNTTMTTVLYLYTQSFSYLKMGYASSIAYIYFILMFALAILQMGINKLISKKYIKLYQNDEFGVE